MEDSIGVALPVALTHTALRQWLSIQLSEFVGVAVTLIQSNAVRDDKPIAQHHR